MSTTNGSPFPTKLADLYFDDTAANLSIYATLKHLRKSTLALHNRLVSILADATYISDVVHPSFPSLPLIANERCGSWYIPPALKSSSAYFKSTDGHYGAWAFSLRRLNLQVLDLLGVSGGAVLVDSTRRGKRMPDALRRTVPIWVLVWNVVLFGDEIIRHDEEWTWAFRLQHPDLEPGEIDLIEKRLGGWADGLKGMGLALDGFKKRLRRPIRLMWVVHGEDMNKPNLEIKLPVQQCNLLVLCSASRRVLGAEMSEDGYVQGAADDAEGWSGGLTSGMFWRYKDELLESAEEDLPELLARLIRQSKALEGDIQAVQIRPTRNIYVGASHPQSKIVNLELFDLVVSCHAKTEEHHAQMICLGCRSGKSGSRDLREKLAIAITNVSAKLKRNTDSKILVVCENGRDLSVGVAVALLCSLYDEDGQILETNPVVIDKQLVKKRLVWITSIKPDANPSRSTLQAVNSFLMSG